MGSYMYIWAISPHVSWRPANDYGIMRTKDVEDKTLRTRLWGQATLRTGDFEDRRLWGQTFLYKTSRTDIEDKHFPQLNIYFIYFIYFIFYNIDSKYYIIHCGQTLRLWGQTLRTDIEDNIVNGVKIVKSVKRLQGLHIKGCT